METATIISEQAICVYVTCKNKLEARAIGKVLVEEKLVASANILPQIESLFYWGETKDSIEFQDVEESLLLLFCSERNFETVKAKVLELHSYILPCIVALPISLGHSDFIEWIVTSSK